MKDVPALGKLCDVTSKRDAVHVAVAPVIAAEELGPGQHVGFVKKGNTELVGWNDAETFVGVVDPFLSERVKKGERFWLFLYPGTIVSLRHDWVHPAFDTVPTDAEKEESERWLRIYAAKLNSYDPPEEAFDSLIDGLKASDIRTHGYGSVNGPYDMPDIEELRMHAERYLGIRLRSWDDFSFSCAC